MMRPGDRGVRAASGVTAQPIYFSGQGQQLSGWLHRSFEVPARDVGIVVCKPFGYEAICAYRSLRAFADSLAATGAPTLRFDYQGTGDADDLDPEADQIKAWSDSILVAADELRRRTGVPRIILLGIRLGALLAWEAAGRSANIDGIIAIAPVLQGGRYIREMRAFEAAMPTLSAPLASPEATPETSNGGMDSAGFALSAATLASLAALNISQPASCPVPQLLVIDRATLPSAQSWSTRLSTAGVAVEYRQLHGYDEMVTTPHATQVPTEMILESVVWLTSRVVQSRAVNPDDTAPVRQLAGMPQAAGQSAADTEPTMTLTNAGGPRGGDLTERAVFIDGDIRLFGIITEPPSGEARRRVVILLNGGATYHVGPNGMYVSWARLWAKYGYFVMRLDIAGLGDSATRPGRPENEVYPPDALKDIAAAINYMRQRYGTRDVSLGGLCAGAYHALRAAVAELPVTRLLMINPLTFYWREGNTLNDLQIAEVVRNPGVYRSRVVSWRSWRRVFSGQVNLLRIVRIYVNRTWLALESWLRDAARALKLRIPNDLGLELEQLAARGIRIVFVFARNDTGVALLRIQGGSSVKKLGELCRVHLIDGADHIFSQRVPRSKMEQILSQELFARTR